MRARDEGRTRTSAPESRVALAMGLAVALASQGVSAQSAPPAPTVEPPAAPAAASAPLGAPGYAAPPVDAPYPYPYPYAYPVYGYGAPALAWPRPTPRERKSTAMFVTGIGLAAGGTIGLLVGSGLFAGAQGSVPAYCEDGSVVYACGERNNEDQEVGGVALMIVGGAMVIGAFPLMLIGGKKVPVAPAGASARSSSAGPELVVGAGRGEVRLRF
jgi:hypothetical protein